MKLEEIIPHLNKVARLYLVNKRRKVGWLFMKSTKEGADAVYFINGMKCRRMVEEPEAKDLEKLESMMEKIPLSDIVRISSIK